MYLRQTSNIFKSRKQLLNYIIENYDNGWFRFDYEMEDKFTKGGRTARFIARNIVDDYYLEDTLHVNPLVFDIVIGYLQKNKITDITQKVMIAALTTREDKINKLLQ